MSWFTNAINWIKGAKAKVSEFFVTVLGQDAAKQLGDATVAALQSALGVIVKDAVIAVASLKLGGDASRAAAFDRIVVDAKSQGLQFSTSLINMLIELAVQQLQNNIVPLSQ
jgi:predicted GNAT family N-acyltransferase